MGSCPRFLANDRICGLITGGCGVWSPGCTYMSRRTNVSIDFRNVLTIAAKSAKRAHPSTRGYIYPTALKPTMTTGSPEYFPFR